jgi:hypothetical protein
MASIPTASVDALVHVKRLRQPKTARLFIIRSGWMAQAGSDRSVYNRSKRGRSPRSGNHFSGLRLVDGLLMSLSARIEEGRK